MGDLLTAARDEGGLELGTISVSVVFLLIIVALVVYLDREEKKKLSAGPARAP
jgi:uncharacterized membrane-anchored protein